MLLSPQRNKHSKRDNVATSQEGLISPPVEGDGELRLGTFNIVHIYNKYFSKDGVDQNHWGIFACRVKSLFWVSGRSFTKNALTFHGIVLQRGNKISNGCFGLQENTHKNLYFQTIIIFQQTNCLG